MSRVHEFTIHFPAPDGQLWPADTFAHRLGTAVALSWRWLTAVVLVGAYFVYSATVEERYLTEQFPDAQLLRRIVLDNQQPFASWRCICLEA